MLHLLCVGGVLLLLVAFLVVCGWVAVLLLCIFVGWCCACCWCICHPCAGVGILLILVVGYHLIGGLILVADGARSGVVLLCFCVCWCCVCCWCTLHPCAGVDILLVFVVGYHLGGGFCLAAGCMWSCVVGRVCVGVAGCSVSCCFVLGVVVCVDCVVVGVWLACFWIWGLVAKGFKEWCKFLWYCLLWCGKVVGVEVCAVAVFWC